MTSRENDLLITLYEMADAVGAERKPREHAKQVL